MTVMTLCSQPHLATVDVTSRLPIDGAHHIAAWVFAPPAETAGPVPLLFCLPGGTYSKAYWHLEVPGHSGYSFAEYMAAQGMLVIAVDHINTGDSSRHRHARELLPHVLADANAIAYTQLAVRAQTGELGPGIPPLTLGPQIGVGHSIGAMLAIIQQSRHRCFDAVAALGYGTVGPIVSLRGADDTYRATAEEILQLADTGALDELQVDRTDPQLRHHFYDNVPDEVVAADDPYGDQLARRDRPAVHCSVYRLRPCLPIAVSGVHRTGRAGLDARTPRRSQSIWVIARHHIVHPGRLGALPQHRQHPTSTVGSAGRMGPESMSAGK